MPVIVTPDKYEVWLDPHVNDVDAIRDILKAIRPSSNAALSRQYEAQQFPERRWGVRCSG